MKHFKTGLIVFTLLLFFGSVIAKNDKDKKGSNKQTNRSKSYTDRRSSSQKSTASSPRSRRKVKKGIGIDAYAIGGFNVINNSVKEDGDFKNQYGGFLGASLLLKNIPSLSEKISLRGDLFTNYSRLDEAGYEATIRSYNLALMAGYQLTNKLEAFIGPNFLTGFSDDGEDFLLGGKAEARYNIGKLYLGISYVAIPRGYDVLGNGSSLTRNEDISSTVSLSIAYPIISLK